MLSSNAFFQCFLPSEECIIFKLKKISILFYYNVILIAMKSWRNNVEKQCGETMWRNNVEKQCGEKVALQ